MNIPDSVTAIGSYAFYNCYYLKEATVGDGVTTIGADAFFNSTSLRDITIGKDVTQIAQGAFRHCFDLRSVHFRGNAPIVADLPFTFLEARSLTVYYLPGTMGWAPTFADQPTAIWQLQRPTILTTKPTFAIQTNGIGFRISWATNDTVVVEASTTLANSVWSAVSTNTLMHGWSDFSDSGRAKYPSRFYRVRAQ